MPVALLALFMTGNMALASEVTGTLTTGIEGIAITPIPPIANPVAGAYASVQSVTLSAPGSMSIRYTTNGTLPACAPPAGVLYSGAIAVNSGTAIQAISCYQNNIASTIAAHLYVINIPPVVTPITSGNDSGGGGGGGSGGGGGGGLQQTTTQTKKGDANNDNKVDILDLNSLMVNWGKAGQNVADFNGDVKVDLLDFNILMVNWGK